MRLSHAAGLLSLLLGKQEALSITKHRLSLPPSRGESPPAQKSLENWRSILNCNLPSVRYIFHTYVPSSSDSTVYPAIAIETERRILAMHAAITINVIRYVVSTTFRRCIRTQWSSFI
ncbi:uncharacterized protein EV422DRAFT_382346 [Fimicolochytrium jonesii]|uniref:uncharacterized protein n=1 Tax=Fimicolochytrium jonesii TaxID=1396493 RepID=UPI0022FDC947|nr:uncharacterized protein EV422DRAFT_382346 [Fimicolochytrium jonesii]KAI8822881.1 hypothetical protein EV422DRAFT_382346 [Fimicolochytrium jonesii]